MHACVRGFVTGFHAGQTAPILGLICRVHSLKTKHCVQSQFIQFNALCTENLALFLAPSSQQYV